MSGASAGKNDIYGTLNCNNGGMFGDQGWWVILVILVLFAAGGNWGGNNNGGGAFGGGAPIVINDGNNGGYVQRGFDQAAVMAGLNGIRAADMLNGIEFMTR